MSAFEPALEHYDWSRVFPALSSKEIEQGDNVPVQMPVGMTGNPVQTVRSTVSGKIDLGLEAEDLDKLKTGIHKIAETADNFAGIVGNANPFLAMLMLGVWFSVIGKPGTVWRYGTDSFDPV